MLTKKKGGRPSVRPPLEELSKLYSTKTAKEISVMYKVPLPTVRTWIARARKEKTFND